MVPFKTSIKLIECIEPGLWFTPLSGTVLKVLAPTQTGYLVENPLINKGISRSHRRVFFIPEKFVVR